MRVLFLSETSVTSASGSAQNHRLNKLSEGLNALGIETSFLSLRDMQVKRPTLLFPFNLPFAWSEAKNCDFIHAIGDAAYAAVLWKLFTRTQVVYDVDADTLAEVYMHWQERKSPQTAFWIFQTHIMNWIAYRSRDPYLSVSQPLLDRLVNEKGIPRDLIHLIRNGVDTQLFQPAYGGQDDVCTICYAGGFHVWQGLHNLIEAAQMLRGKAIRIKVIGFREDDKEFKAEIGAALGDMVELVDRVTQPELVKHLSTAHFLIIPRLPHPAVEIAFPTKFSEYLSMGKPVIVSDVDETATLVRQHNCGLVSDPNPQALAETLGKAINLSNDDLVEMGKNGRQLAETVFDWPVVCRKYADLLQEWQG